MYKQNYNQNNFDTFETFDSDNEEEFLSKTKRKQMMENLQEIGENLVLLNDNQLKKISEVIPENLLNAIYEAKRLIAQNARSSKKRQLQFIGKLMRKVDAEIIVAKLNQIQNNHNNNNSNSNNNNNNNNIKNSNNNNTEISEKIHNICQQIINSNNENYIFEFINNLNLSDQQKRDYHFQLRTLKRNIIKEKNKQQNQTENILENNEVNANFVNSKNYKNLFQTIKNIQNLVEIL